MTSLPLPANAAPPKHQKLCYAELVRIAVYLEQHMSPAEIAILIGREKSTVSRLLHGYGELGNDGFWLLDADAAWKRIDEKRRSKTGQNKVLDDELLETFVLDKLQLYWSPEQIAARWQEQTAESLSHETVYQYLYRHQPLLVRLYLRRKGKKYRSQREKQEKYQLPEMRMIGERPEVVEKRERLGDWEGDTLIGKNHRQAIVANVERRSGLLLARKVERKTAEQTADVTKAMLADVPEELRITITYDQGREFAWHKIIEAENKMTVYFCNKACPWQKGSIENTIGLLRQYIPKATDLSTVSDKDLQRYVDLLNNRPRKRHGYRTPLEVFYGSTSQSCD